MRNTTITKLMFWASELAVVGWIFFLAFQGVGLFYVLVFSAGAAYIKSYLELWAIDCDGRIYIYQGKAGGIRSTRDVGQDNYDLHLNWINAQKELCEVRRNLFK